jgi:hypothetical protein
LAEKERGTYISPNTPKTSESTPPPPQPVEPIARYGGTVESSAWDGSVWQVKQWLKDNLKDPKSLDIMEWSKLVEEPDGNLAVRVKYRAKNSFGGYVIENKVVRLSRNGDILGVYEFPE